MVKDMHHGVVYLVVQHVVNQHDPERLLACGYPRDKYDRESEEITGAIEREGPVTAIGLAKIMRIVFFSAYHSWTIESFPTLRWFKPMAKDLWKSLPENCQR